MKPHYSNTINPIDFPKSKNKMNERIRELAEQAEMAANKGDHVDVKIMMEKFAKLIVRECADICDKIYFENYPDAEDYERSEEGDAIKQHFGVEQWTNDLLKVLRKNNTVDA